MLGIVIVVVVEVVCGVVLVELGVVVVEVIEIIGKHPSKALPLWPSLQ